VRRKRRTKYQWLDQFGTEGPDGFPDDERVVREIGIAINANATTSTAVIDYLPDFPSEDSVAVIGTQQSMGLFDRNDYFIKRIVGKIFVSVSPQATTTAPAVLVGIGMFIARAEEGGQLVNTPIGFATVPDNYNVLRTRNTKEPWIWRRTWVLGNSLTTSADTRGLRTAPPNNAGYGSVLDGPHVDAKTARRIRDGERFFIAMSGLSLPNNTTHTTAITANAQLDLRLLGAPRKTHNRSVF